MINRYSNTRYRTKKTFLIAMVLFTSYATPQSSTYEGERNQKGEPHGQGIVTYSSGDKYLGEFKNGKRNGHGTFTFPDGDK